MNTRYIIPQSKWGKIRLGAIVTVLFAVIGYVYLIPFYGYVSYDPKEGDIIFQSLYRSGLVKAIEGCTDSPYSHCGVVVNRVCPLMRSISATRMTFSSPSRPGPGRLLPPGAGRQCGGHRYST